MLSARPVGPPSVFPLAGRSAMAHASMTRPERTRVVVGVDTHKDIHVARAKDSLGRLLGERTVPARSGARESCLRGLGATGRSWPSGSRGRAPMAPASLDTYGARAAGSSR